MEKKEVVNLYEVLGVKRNATFKEIKIAYISKVQEITESFKNGTAASNAANYLMLVNKALDTFSTSVGRYIHDCEIDGEEPDFGDSGEDYYAESFEGDNDFSVEEDKIIIEWLKLIIRLYSEVFTTIQAITSITEEEYKKLLDSMVENCSTIEEKLQKKITPRRQLYK